MKQIIITTGSFLLLFLLSSPGYTQQTNRTQLGVNLPPARTPEEVRAREIPEIPVTKTYADLYQTTPIQVDNDLRISLGLPDSSIPPHRHLFLYSCVQSKSKEDNHQQNPPDSVMYSTYPRALKRVGPIYVRVVPVLSENHKYREQLSLQLDPRGGVFGPELHSTDGHPVYAQMLTVYKPDLEISLHIKKWVIEVVDGQEQLLAQRVMSVSDPDQNDREQLEEERHSEQRSSIPVYRELVNEHEYQKQSKRSQQQKEPLTIRSEAVRTGRRIGGPSWRNDGEIPIVTLRENRKRDKLKVHYLPNPERNVKAKDPLPRVIAENPDSTPELSWTVSWRNSLLVYFPLNGIPLRSIRSLALIRWWVNGTPATGDIDRKNVFRMPSSLDRDDSKYQIRVPLHVFPSALGANPGDRMSLQLLLAPTDTADFNRFEEEEKSPFYLVQNALSIHTDRHQFVLDQSGVPRPELNGPLLKAAWTGHKKSIKTLIEQGTNPNRTDPQGRTPLMLAAYRGHTDIVETLIDADASVQKQDDIGRTARMYAVLNGQLKTFQAMTGNNQPRVRVPGSANELVSAARNGRMDMLKVLFKAGADKKFDTLNRPLNAAVENQQEDVVRYLLDVGASPNEQKPSGFPLSTAAEEGHADIAKQLIEHGSNMRSSDNETRTPLMKAARKGHIDVVHVLLEHGAEPDRVNEEHGPALASAIEESRLKSVQYLLEHGADPNIRTESGYSLLIQSTAMDDPGMTSIINELIAHGADVNVKDWSNETPLHNVLQNGNLKNVPGLTEHLLEAGAKVNVRTDDGNTPLMTAAAHRNNKKIAEMLIEQGADVQKTDREKRPPLAIAAETGNEKVIETLLDHGARIDRRSGDGRTPLMHAVRRGQLNAVDTLLNAGADPFYWELTGENTIRWVTLNNRKETRDRLIRAQNNRVQTFLKQQFDPSEKTTRKKVKRLIQKLSHDRLSERKAATKQLKEIGKKAIPQLKKHRDSSEPSVRYRVQFILEHTARNHLNSKWEK